MNTQTPKSDHSLLKLKVALTAGGLVATIIGAGLLGNRTTAYTNANTDNLTTSETAVTTSINSNMPLELDLNLETIPTVTAPTFRNVAVARGRSSG